MSEENVELVRDLFRHWGEGHDLVAFAADEEALAPALEMMDPEIEIRWSEEIPDVKTYRGHRGVIAAMRDWLEAWDEFHMEAQEFIDAGSQVVVTFHQTGRGRGSGVDTEMEVAQVYTVRDGKVVRVREYSSRNAALRAAGVTI